jgi:hypothetical protein
VHSLRYDTVLSDRTSIVAVSCEWVTGLARYCSRQYARLVGINDIVCPHVLQTLMMSSVHTSCRFIMALTSDALKTCMLKTCEPNYTDMLARLFFMLRYVAHREP